MQWLWYPHHKLVVGNNFVIATYAEEILCGTGVESSVLDLRLFGKVISRLDRGQHALDRQESGLSKRVQGVTICHRGTRQRRPHSDLDMSAVETALQTRPTEGETCTQCFIGLNKDCPKSWLGGGFSHAKGRCSSTLTRLAVYDEMIMSVKNHHTLPTTLPDIDL